MLIPPSHLLPLSSPTKWRRPCALPVSLVPPPCSAFLNSPPSSSLSFDSFQNLKQPCCRQLDFKRARSASNCAKAKAAWDENLHIHTLQRRQVPCHKHHSALPKHPHFAASHFKTEVGIVSLVKLQDGPFLSRYPSSFPPSSAGRASSRGPRSSSRFSVAANQRWPLSTAIRNAHIRPVRYPRLVH
ncbi:hypothetical protein C8R46DRAFT_1100979, partial [Mycena filopes]